VLSDATVLHRGLKIATAEGRVTSERDGRLLAHATTTCLLFPAT
jgi:acyl-coenzyme A thioesterase PaaI-like protein